MMLGPFRSNAPIGPNIYVWGSQAKKWQYGAAILYDTHHITYGQVAGEIWHWITTLPLRGQIFLTAWLLLNISAHIWQNSLLKYSAKYLPNFALFYCTSSRHPTPSRAGGHPLWPLNPTRRGGRCQTSCPSQRGGSESSSLFSFHFCTGPLQ